MSALLELVVCVNNSRWPHVLLYLAAQLTTVSFDYQITYTGIKSHMVTRVTEKEFAFNFNTIIMFN